MSWYIVKLRFTTPVHFGADKSGIGIEAVQPFLHSDTLFSALCNAWAQFRIFTTTEIDGFKAVFDSSPPFILSSAFPFKREKHGFLYYLPKPIVNTNQFDLFKSEMRPEQISEWKKQFKNARFIPSDFFEKWLKSERFMEEGCLELLHAWKEIFTEEIRPHHAQDRLTMMSELFHHGEIFFEQDMDCGLYFIVKFPTDETWKSKLNQGLKALSLTGLGGDRNLGMGRFRYDDENFGTLKPIDKLHPLFFLTQDDESSTKHSILSLFYPENEEIQLIKTELQSNPDSVAYELIKRKGWSFSTATFLQMKRKTINMFAEGSSFELPGHIPKGTLVDVKPEGYPHSVWRCGIALSVPLSSN